MYQIDPESETITPDDDSLYPHVNNDIEYLENFYSKTKLDFENSH